MRGMGMGSDGLDMGMGSKGGQSIMEPTVVLFLALPLLLFIPVIQVPSRDREPRPLFPVRPPPLRVLEDPELQVQRVELGRVCRDEALAEGVAFFLRCSPPGASQTPSRRKKVEPREPTTNHRPTSSVSSRVAVSTRPASSLTRPSSALDLRANRVSMASRRER